VTDWASLRYVVVDVEGNGQQPPDLVELAVVPIAGGVIGEPAAWLVQPPHPIRHFASTIHGIRTSDVAHCPSLADVAAEIGEALQADALVAHAAHVDVGVLRRELQGWQPPEVFDTLRLARRLMPGLPSYKLGTLTERLRLAAGLPAGLKPHRAGYDALVAARLFVALATKAASLEVLRGEPSGGDDKERDDALF
jgi:DNA polymerase III epsilon subunit-like protein